MNDTIIKGCGSCLYMATHERCRGCLSDSGKRDGTLEGSYNYANYEQATREQAMARIHELESLGQRNIVIGWQGEAEANAFETPKNAYRRLFRVSCECGYFVAAPVTNGHATTVDIQLPHGLFRLHWDHHVFERITREDSPTPRVVWTRATKKEAHAA